jgi:hypothetical protein
MNNVLNERVKRLIKKDLVGYGKHLLWFLGLTIVIPVIFQVIFANSVLININSDIKDLGDNLFNFFSSGYFILVVGFAGITAGAELSQYVRKGVSRKDYFIATTVAAVIVSLLIPPLMLLLNMIINLFVSSESLFYHVFDMDGSKNSILVMQCLIFLTLFLLGYCTAIVWQRVGWYISTAIIVVCFMIAIFLGINFEFDWLNNNYWFEMEGFFPIVMGLIAILGIGTYKLIKNVSVKTK